MTQPVIKKDQPDDNYKFQPLPQPEGEYPYHLNLTNIRPTDEDHLSFHMVGDTGSLLDTDNNQLVAQQMANQYNTKNAADKPQFLFHLGDIVYSYGEAEGYGKQFFKTFHDYPGPIFAIAGNHDADINPLAKVPYQSLDAFTTVFCDAVSQPVIFSGGSKRKSMTQPNIYWTLHTPLATIIGLYSNVPKYGVITAEQRNWFIEELKAADMERPDKALILCLHHAPYSADINHGSSIPMINFLEGVFKETGIKPDIVFSGHVHNYQRFNKVYGDGITVPYIVAGAGGFDELHPLAAPDDKGYSSNHPLFDGVSLAHYRDDRHGFLKISLRRIPGGLTLTGQYFTITRKEGGKASLADSFTIKLP